jgi:asparagine synthase (glutamine-hydrolysing)
MCGICGFSWEDGKIIRVMAKQLAHRGPDQEGIYTDSFVSLGHKRLSIIDLSEKGSQPMSNEEGNVWLVYNGEIYNFSTLKEDLEKKGHQFVSHTDSEVIIHAYEEYGAQCVNLFNGMFAFAIWDSVARKLILARDRLGIKPLFYFFSGERLVFGSEIKSILKNPEIKKELNLSGFSQFIYYSYTINGETMFKNIHEVLPGHFLVYDFKSVEIKEYWKVKTSVQNQDENFFAEHLKILLKESVRKRMVADVALGASLSGGIDSSAVVAFMSQLCDEPIKTFTIGFNDQSDELGPAKTVAEYCKTEHHEIMVDFGEITKSLPRIVWHAEAPFARPSMFSGYFLSRGINRNKVIIDLSGSGGDEVFAGYNRYFPYLSTNQNLSNLQKADKIVSTYFPADADKNEFFMQAALNEMDNPLKPRGIFLPYLEKTDRGEHVNAALEFELKTELPGIQLFRDDRMSMAHSHEVRVPLLDHELVEFGMTIPSSLKWYGNRKKYIFQKAMNGLLPRDIVQRVKLPFGMPLFRYFKEDFIDVAEGVLDKSAFMKGSYIKRGGVLDKFKKVKSGTDTKDNSLRQVLFFTTLSIFSDIFLEAEIKDSSFEISRFL